MATEINFKAAKFYIAHQGIKPTEKRIENLLKQLPSETIVRMAKERGFNLV